MYCEFTNDCAFPSDCCIHPYFVCPNANKCALDVNDCCEGTNTWCATIQQCVADRGECPKPNPEPCVGPNCDKKVCTEPEILCDGVCQTPWNCCSGQGRQWASVDMVCCDKDEIVLDGSCCNPLSNSACCNAFPGHKWDKLKHKCMCYEDPKKKTETIIAASNFEETNVSEETVEEEEVIEVIDRRF